MSTPDLNVIHAFALKLAQQAGELILEEREACNLKFDYKNKKGEELVTSADLKSDDLIRGEISRQFPDHVIISEESSFDGGTAENLKKRAWIIDPIDGTINYAHNHRQVGISIGFAMDEKLQVGVVHSPFQNETFSAIRGQGAWLNEKRIEVSKKKIMNKALIGTGFPYDKSAIEPLLRQLRQVLTHCQDIRRIGSAALDLCWVAAGRLDGFYETLSLWDFAAGLLIAREAGAKTGHFGEKEKGIPEEFSGKNIVVANPELYSELKRLLDEA